jgi:dihydrofolate reductase
VISIVVAHARNRTIGRDGELPWHLPTDMRHFKQLTLGTTVVMGRRTFESLPEPVRPLPERRNLVLSRRRDFDAAGAEVFADLDSALEACAGDCFVIGGGMTYAEALAHAGRVYATEVAADVDGDVFFPELPDSVWRCTSESATFTENSHEFVFRVYDRGR